MDEDFLKLIETVSKLDIESTLPESLLPATSNKLKEYLLCEQIYGEDRPPEDTDFKDHKTKSLLGLNCLLTFLTKIEKLPWFKPNEDFVVGTLLFCGEHTSKNLWTTLDCVNTSLNCLNILTSIHKCKSTSDLLLNKSSRQMYISAVLMTLRPKLLKNTWRKYPAAIHVYQWVLLQVKSPFLSDHLDTVYPTALIILDDYVTSRRLMGLTCITHIVQNVPRTDLCSRGLDNVLYHAVTPLLLLREPELVTPIYECMATLLGSVEKGYTKSVAQGQWSRLESTLLTLLHNMEFEDRLILRLAYVKSLDPILKVMGPSVIQLSKKLLNVFEEYLDKRTPDSRHYAIMAFGTFIHFSKERLPWNGDKVLYLLFRTLYDLTKEMGSCNTCPKTYQLPVIEEPWKTCATHNWDDLQVVIKCIQFIESCLPEQFHPIRQDIKEKIDFNDLLTDIVKRLFN